MTTITVPRRRATRRGAACLILLAGAACGKPSASAPAPTAAAAPLPPLEPAVLSLPITISATAVRAQLDGAIPRADSLDRARCQALGGAVCHQYVFTRDTLGVRFTGDRVEVLARLRYRGRVAVSNVGSLGSCGYPPEPMRRAELRLSTTLYGRSDWRLASRGTSLTSQLPDPCEVTVLRVDATPLMKRVADAQLARVAQQVDSALPAVADLQATGGGRLALGPRLDAARRQITRQMNRPLAPDVAVGGGVRELRVTGVHATASAFVVRVLLEGEAGLWAR